MKRKFAWILAVCLLAAALSGCGASGSSTEASAPAAMAPMESADYGRTDMAAGGMNGGSFATAGAVVEEQGIDSSEVKRIYTADLWLETTAFDEAVASLTELVETCGGWFEYGSVSSGGSGYRYGNYTVRVPVEKFQLFLNQVGELCHVVSSSTYTEDVSEVYYDTAGRLKTQQTKLERLQELLSRAESMEDIITIESAISETEQQIEALSGQLRHYDARVDYSTVTLDLNEVYQLSNVEQPAEGFGQRLSVAFSSGWNGFVEFMQGLTVALAYSWVFVLLLAAAAAAVVYRLRKKRREKSAPKPPRKPDSGDPQL